MTVRKVRRTVEEWYITCSRYGRETRVESGSVSVPSLCCGCQCVEADEKLHAEHGYLIGAVVKEFRTTGGRFPDLSAIRLRTPDGRLFDVSGEADSDGRPSLDVEEVFKE